jgi:hypothetical protein
MQVYVLGLLLHCSVSQFIGSLQLLDHSVEASTMGSRNTAKHVSKERKAIIISKKSFIENGLHWYHSIKLRICVTHCHKNSHIPRILRRKSRLFSVITPTLIILLHRAFLIMLEDKALCKRGYTIFQFRTEGDSRGGMCNLFHI